MTPSASASQFDPEFENFLFAPIGADRNGMLLSVLSALARLDIDPWQEAVQLAALPEETATRRLSSLIAALPDGPSARPRDECRSPDRAPAASRRFKDRPARGSAQRRCGNPVAGHHIRVCDLYGHRTERAMDRSRPSAAGAGRQRSGADLQHRFPSGATVDLQVRKEIDGSVPLPWSCFSAVVIERYPIVPDLRSTGRLRARRVGRLRPIQPFGGDPERSVASQFVRFTAYDRTHRLSCFQRRFDELSAPERS